MPHPLIGVTWIRAAGTMATNPVMPAITPSLELASTSSESERTIEGTMACLDTRYVFCRTRAAKTRGNSVSESMENAISTASTARAAGDELDDRPAPAGGTVDDRPDQRGDHEERSEADDEEQQHPAPRRRRVDAQEQRVGEGDEHRRIPTHHRPVGDRQPSERRHPTRPSHPGSLEARREMEWKSGARQHVTPTPAASEHVDGGARADA